MLHRDLRRAAPARSTGAASARSGTGASAPVPILLRPSGPGLSQIEFDTPSRPRPCTRPGPAQRASLVAGAARAGGRPRGEICHGAGVPERVRRLQVDEVATPASAASNWSPRQHARPARARPSMTASQVAAVSRPPRISSASRAQQRGQRRVELRAAHACAPASVAASVPPDAVRDLDELGQLRDPRRDRDTVARQLPRPALPVPLLVGAPTASSTASGNPSCAASVRASAACCAIIPSRSRWPENANSSPTRNRCSGGLPAADQPQRRGRAAHAALLVVVLGRLQRDVVAEPLRLLMRVGVAADVDQQRRVVDAAALLVVRDRPARPAATRSGTGAARAPSAARSPGRSRATAPRPARRAVRAPDRSPQTRTHSIALSPGRRERWVERLMNAVTTASSVHTPTSDQTGTR